MATSDISIRRIVRRSILNRALLSLAGIAAVAFGVSLSLDYFDNFFNGPYEMTNAQLVDFSTPGKGHYYVTIKPDDLAEAGFERVTSNYGIETGTETFYLFLVGDHLLLAETPGTFEGRTQTGSLVSIPTDTRREVVDVLLAEYPEMDGTLLPFMFEGGDFRTSGYIGLVVAGVVLAVSLWGLYGSLQFSKDFCRHPILRDLKRCGDAEAVAGQIEQELRGLHPTVGTVHFTPSWIVQASRASLSAVRPQDVMWVYKQVIQHRRYGIPIYKTFAAQIFDRYGKQITINGKEGIINAALAGIGERAPWALGGYSAEVERLWKENRAGVVAAVDARRSGSST